MHAKSCNLEAQCPESLNYYLVPNEAFSMKFRLRGYSMLGIAHIKQRQNSQIIV